MKFYLMLTILLTFISSLSSCGGGGGSNSGAENSNSPTNSEQNPDQGNNGSGTSSERVARCKEELKLSVKENGTERPATPAEIAQQGYQIAQKCQFTEDDLLLYLKVKGIK